MIDALTGMGYGIIALSVVIGIGLVILYSLSSNISSCPTGYLYYDTNASATNVCCNVTAKTCVGSPNSTAVSTGSSSVYTLSGYLGTGTGGLATWVPIVIVMVMMGILFKGLRLIYVTCLT